MLKCHLQSKDRNFFYNKFCFFFPLMKGVLPLFNDFYEYYYGIKRQC